MIVDSVVELCRLHKTTIAQLERDIGVSRGSIYKWNEHSPSIDKVNAVANRFGISVDSLIKGEISNENIEGE